MNIINMIFRKLLDISPILIGPKNCAVNTYDITIKQDILIRVYESKNKVINSPIMIYLHGGGFVMGSVKAYDRILKYISFHANCTIVAIEYRKAPEKKFPTALIDVYEGYIWVINEFFKDNTIPRKLIFGGDSAGGTLSIGLLKLINESKGPDFILPDALILIYPLLETRIRTASSVEKKGFIYQFSKLFLKYCLDQYFNDNEEYNSKYVSHIDNLSNLIYPPVYIITAELDSLTYGINEYVKKLQAHGIKAYYKEYDNTLHGFLNFSAISTQAVNALNDIITFINSK